MFVTTCIEKQCTRPLKVTFCYHSRTFDKKFLICLTNVTYRVYHNELFISSFAVCCIYAVVVLPDPVPRMEARS